MLALAAAFGLSACVGCESSESSPSGRKEEAWYEGAGFFYLDKILFKEDENESPSFSRGGNSGGSVHIFRQQKNN